MEENSYTFDPAVGEAVPTSQIADSSEERSAQEISDDNQKQIFSETAEYLSNRQQGSTEFMTGADESQMDVELELAQVQQKLHRADELGLSYMEKMQLESKANTLASHLVGGGAPSNVSKETLEEPPLTDDELNEEIINRFPGIQETLQFAADNLPEATATQWNEQLQSSNPEDRLLAARALTSFQNDREHFTTADDGYSAFSADQVNNIVELVGAQHADAITTINAALVAGTATAPQVMQLVSKDPGLVRALHQCASEGVIKIGFWYE